MIEVQHFSKSYGAETAVDDLSFSLKPGQILGLVGRNGAGKTTTLRAITGIVPFGVGTMEVDGYDLANDPVAVKQRTAYVPDDPKLFEDLSVEQHLRFQASVYGIKDPAQAMDRLLGMFELEGKRHHRARDLSRGMRQKLAICSAYLQKPLALLLDEPMTGLDPQGIRVLKQSIQDQAQSGTAVIISSHLLAMVEDICTHVLVLDEGRSRFFGTLEQLQQRYRMDSRDPGDTASLEAAFFGALSEIEVAIENSKDVAPTLLSNDPFLDADELSRPFPSPDNTIGR